MGYAERPSPGAAPPPISTMRTRHATDPCELVKSESSSSSALGLVVLGCLWFYFAPVPLGGSTTYVVTHGVSMEPRFHTGDLALVHSQSSYHVGEIVAYDNNMLRTVVLHRIIARDGSRYVFKGDNNKFIDPEHPAASQLIGALWLHVPAVARVCSRCARPHSWDSSWPSRCCSSPAWRSRGAEGTGAGAGALARALGARPGHSRSTPPGWTRASSRSA